MRSLFITLSLLVVLGSPATNATPIPKNDQAKLNALSRKVVLSDFRLVFRLVKGSTFCGGEGDEYVGQVEMNKPRRFMKTNGEIGLADHWVKIDKHYSMRVDELHGPTPGFLDWDNCLE